jgi:hypothetical protein
MRNDLNKSLSSCVAFTMQQARAEFVGNAVHVSCFECKHKLLNSRLM